MPTLTAKKPKPTAKRKSKPTPARPSLGQRLIKAMREVRDLLQGDDVDALRYTIPVGATGAEVLAITRAAEKKLREKQASRRARLAVCPLAAADVYAVRRALGAGVSTEWLAALLNVPDSLVEAWEDGTKAPTGAALRLLADIRARPDYWRDQLHAASGSDTPPAPGAAS